MSNPGEATALGLGQAGVEDRRLAPVSLCGLARGVDVVCVPVSVV